MRTATHILWMLAVVLTLSVSILAGTYSGGNGTEADPYQIATVADWQELMNTSADWDKHFILTADIDLAGVSLTPVAPDTDPNDDWHRFQGTPFSGIFDGNGHVLRNTIIHLPGNDHVGLFGLLGSYGQIKNLGVENVNIQGRCCVGGLVGSNGDEGNSRANITSCYAKGIVSGESSVGGLVGRNEWNTITASYAEGTVSGSGDVGGLVGFNQTGVIITSYSTGAVNGGGSVGGLVGYSGDAWFVSCYATGAVSGNQYVGGLVGFNFAGCIFSCYSTGKVTGMGDHIAGLLNWIDPIGVVENCFWDIQTSTQTSSEAGTGKTTAEMQSISTFLEAGWDFNAVWEICDGKDYPRLQWEGSHCPYSGGSGTEADPYKIATLADLITLGNTTADYDKHFVLIADIDLAGQTFTHAVIAPDISTADQFQGTPFTGTFDGKGHVIRNMVIDQPSKDHVGLFGRVTANGQIRNLGVVAVNVSGRNFVGGLVGRNELGTITSCYATGTVIGTGAYIGGMVGYIEYGTIASCYATSEVSGSSYVGSLVGESDNMATITSCYATGTVIGTGTYIGGLVGGNGSGPITSCYATGPVRGNNKIGGLCGSNARGSITSCYATGLVSGISDIGGLLGFNEGGTITDSFWDIQTSNQTTSDGGTGKTTAQMKARSTFTDAGWDFVGETVNGTADIWRMPSGGYPILSWQPWAICILTPNGGESYLGGMVRNITWSAEGVGDQLLLQYSVDNGGSWIDIAAVSNTGTYPWIVPNISSNTCLVKISSIDDPLILDISDAVFSIVIPHVYFADANLKAAVEEKLGVTNPTAEDMLKLTTLNAKSKGITSLVGLETALNLTILYLHQNAISDIAPLAGLNKLTTLNLYLNNITNIAPLSGLTKLSYLSLSSNKISDISALAPMTNLVYLYMASNQISDFSSITGQTKFKEIYATRNAVLTKETYLAHIPAIRANNSNLAVFQYDPGCKTLMGGDVNQDCRVNLSDLAMMASNWLKCNHIYEEMCP